MAQASFSNRMSQWRSRATSRTRAPSTSSRGRGPRFPLDMDLDMVSSYLFPSVLFFFPYLFYFSLHVMWLCIVIFLQCHVLNIMINAFSDFPYGNILSSRS